VAEDLVIAKLIAATVEQDTLDAMEEALARS
jgi:hypothetical protein